MLINECINNGIKEQKIDEVCYEFIDQLINSFTVAILYSDLINNKMIKKNKWNQLLYET